LIPGGSQDWSGLLGVNSFRIAGSAAADCIALTTAASPILPIDREDARFDSSNSGWATVIGLHAITQNATAMMGELFFDRMGVPADARLNACIGISNGAFLGFQLMDNWQGLACDGLLLVVGGDGMFPLFEGNRSLCTSTQTIPLTGQAVPDAACAAEHRANLVGPFDQDFREDVLQTLATDGEAAARALLMAMTSQHGPGRCSTSPSDSLPRETCGAPQSSSKGLTMPISAPF